jgi:glycolate oxidase FAD binding subunit
MSTSTPSVETLQAALGALVGGRARPADASDAVAGVQPKVIVEPASEEEVAAVLAAANRDGLKVLVRGGGTQLGLGFPPEGGDILLSTTRLDRVVEYNPQDLTVTAQAGLRLAALQETLGGSRQWLALDPPIGPEATLGGLVATNATGPRRLRYGGVRDQIIGVRFVTADGTIAKAGGKVVKNVAGYDLSKLMTGSLGTLGVIVEVAFRLYPLPQASRTVALSSAEPGLLCELAVRVIATTLVPTVLDVAGSTVSEGAYTLAARFESGAEAAEDQARALIELADALGTDASVLRDDEEADFWQRLDAGQQPSRGAGSTLTLKVSLLPSDVADWLGSLDETARRLALEARWRAHAGHGLIFVHLAGDEDTLAQAVEALRRAALERRGSLVVWDAPAALAARVDVWGPSPAVELMRRVKASFDPNATLNPGRFLGRI